MSTRETLRTPASPAELSIAAITGITPVQQRYWRRRGWTIGMFGSIRPPKVGRGR